MSKTKPASEKPKIKATLELTVHFDDYMDLPSRNELEEIVDAARVHGRVAKATYKTLAPVTEELV